MPTQLNEKNMLKSQGIRKHQPFSEILPTFLKANCGVYRNTGYDPKQRSFYD